jgi:hypothetical protein
MTARRVAIKRAEYVEVITNLNPITTKKMEKKEGLLYSVGHFFCEVTEKYYSAENFSRNYGYIRPDIHHLGYFCKQACLEADLMYCCEAACRYYLTSAHPRAHYRGRLNQWVCLSNVENSSEWYENGLYSWYEVEDEYDDDDLEDGIPYYHSCNRNWAIPNGTTFGVELETYCRRYLDAYNKRPEGIIGERDSSLHDEYGVEYIGPPLLFADYADPEGMWKQMLKVLRNHGAKSYNAGVGYGMHVSVGRKGIPMDVQAKFVLFINSNKSFSEKIAGRRESNWAAYNIRDHGQAESAVRFGYGGKYSATNIESHRIEVRIFRGTLFEDGFMKNMEYVASSLEFAREAALEDLNVEKFLEWIKDKTDQYPTLIQWLHTKNYYGENA